MSILEQKRKEKGYSRRSLSIVTGISERTLEAYEQGLRKADHMSLRSAYMLCKILDISLYDLIGENNFA